MKKKVLCESNGITVNDRVNLEKRLCSCIGWLLHRSLDTIYTISCLHSSDNTVPISVVKYCDDCWRISHRGPTAYYPCVLLVGRSTEMISRALPARRKRVGSYMLNDRAASSYLIIVQWTSAFSRYRSRGLVYYEWEKDKDSP